MGNRVRTWACVLIGVVGFNGLAVIGCGGGSSGGGGFVPPPPPPAVPSVAFTIGMIGTQESVVLPAQVQGYSFSLTAADGTITIQSVTVTATGTADETQFGAATLVEDNNPSNGQADPAEIAAAIAVVASGFAVDNGQVTFQPINPFMINPGQTRNLIVVLDGSPLNGTGAADLAIVGSTVDMQIAQATDIGATGQGPITPGGLFGTNWGPVTLGKHDHLLITEICEGAGVGPASAEFIEIYNPTGQTIALTNYYIGDVSYNAGAQVDDFQYYTLSTASTGLATTFAPLNSNVSTTDFVVGFPATTTIAPGEAIVIALDGGGFAAAFPTPPVGLQVFVLRNAQAGQTQMMTWDGPQGSLSFSQTPLPDTVTLDDNGEPITLFFFDPTTTPPSDLVTDVDQVFYGTPTQGNTANDKNGVSIDGFDNGAANQADVTTYQPETTAVNQALMTAPNPNVANPCIHRVHFREGAEPQANGNGTGGDDEMGEDLNNTFVIGTPTPGSPSR